MVNNRLLRMREEIYISRRTVKILDDFIFNYDSQDYKLSNPVGIIMNKDNKLSFLAEIIH